MKDEYINYNVLEELSTFADIENKINAARKILRDDAPPLTISFTGNSESVSIPINTSMAQQVYKFLDELKANNDSRAAIAIKDIQNGRAWSPVNEKRMWSK